MLDRSRWRVERARPRRDHASMADDCVFLIFLRCPFAGRRLRRPGGGGRSLCHLPELPRRGVDTVESRITPLCFPRLVGMNVRWNGRGWRRCCACSVSTPGRPHDQSSRLVGRLPVCVVHAPLVCGLRRRSNGSERAGSARRVGVLRWIEVRRGELFVPVFAPACWGY